jgi:hypothetical protein
MNKSAHWLIVCISVFSRQSFAHPSLPLGADLKGKYFQGTYNFFLYFSIKISDNKFNIELR